ncbi:hypothetical protein PGT21_004893 [Puccinia graminis f. sp. tritici]|uniref:Uncharacterized protein n=1 Tax=Puccinia graminis f. sp. tritici TaxID=56615 RepID=A0A5B0NLL5_PUCGR|nr:hypothetical protein PGT21_004893 [Puccinia graminis f. sp. tritici]
MLDFGAKQASAGNTNHSRVGLEPAGNFGLGGSPATFPAGITGFRIPAGSSPTT